MRRAAKVDANQAEIGWAGACRNCGLNIVPPFNKDGTAKQYCSRRCVGAAIGRRGDLRVRGALNEYMCAQCGDVFNSYYKNRKFCSRKCTGLYRQSHVPEIKRHRVGRRRFNGGKKDKNHDEIVAALVDAGCSVIDLTSIGGGVPDLAVGFNGKWYVMEVKNKGTYYGRKGPNENQKEWIGRQKAPVHIVTSAVEAVGVIRMVAP